MKTTQTLYFSPSLDTLCEFRVLHLLHVYCNSKRLEPTCPISFDSPFNLMTPSSLSWFLEKEDSPIGGRHGIPKSPPSIDSSGSSSPLSPLRLVAWQRNVLLMCARLDTVESLVSVNASTCCNNPRRRAVSSKRLVGRRRNVRLNVIVDATVQVFMKSNFPPLFFFPAGRMFEKEIRSSSLDVTWWRFLLGYERW